MAQNIILKRSATSGKIPTTASLALGELAINTYDGKAFLKQSGSEHKVLTLLATDNNGNINYTGSLNLTASFAATASYINPLNQAVTITGSVTISGSTTQVGNNTLFGNTLLTGSITISGSTTTPSTPTIRVSGDMETDGVIKFLPVNRNINTSISASYMYVSGSTQDLYFSQNGRGYNNVTRLRWLEGNLYTGLLHGGLITTQSSTVYRVSSGSGIIVNLNASLNDDPYPVIQFLEWGNLSASISPLTASYQQAFVGIDSTNNIFAQGTPFSNGQFDNIINIGGVFFQNQSTINGVKTQPSVAYGFQQQQNIFNRAFGPLKLSGYTLAPSGSSTLGLIVASGTAYAPGANYTVDPNEPSYTVDNGTSISKIFRYRQSGSTWVYDTNGGAGYTTINPGQYSNNGTLTTVQPNDWSIQRVFWFPNSVIKAIVVYYGNQSYSTEADAIANISIESFVEAPNTSANAIYLGAIIIRGNGVLTVPADFTIVPGGLFRQVGGSGGGGSIITQTLSGLSDVSISGPTNGEALVYSSTAAKWENKSFISASISGTAGTAISASFATTASYVLNAVSASYASNLGGFDSTYFVDVTSSQTIEGTKTFISQQIFGQFGAANGKLFLYGVDTGNKISIEATGLGDLTFLDQTSSTLATLRQDGTGFELPSGSKFYGDLFGNADTATTASYVLASGIAGLNLSQMATGSVTASVNVDGNLFRIVDNSNTIVNVSSVGSLAINPTGFTAGVLVNGDTIGTIVLKTTASSGFSITADSTNGFSIYDINDNNTRFYMNDSGSFGLNTTSVDGYALSVSGSSRFFNNVDIAGSLRVTGSIIGSLVGTASFATQALSASNANTLDGLDSTDFVTISGDQIISSNKSISSLYKLSFVGPLDGIVSIKGGSIDDLSITDDLLLLDNSGNALAGLYQDGTGFRLISGSFLGNLIGTASLASTASFVRNAVSASYVLNAASSSFATTASYILNAASSSFASTASFVNRLNQNVNINGNSTITGSLTVTNDLIVLGSASLQFISQSTLNIGTNIITVNTFNPTTRFGGLSVIDSGSSPAASASFLYDSFHDEFIFVHRGDSINVTSSHFLVGPQTYNDVGNEIYISNNTLLKSQGNEHVIGSNITDTGTFVGINSNTAVTGSFTVISGSNIELQVTNTGVRLGNIITDTHTITGSLGISGSLILIGSGASPFQVRGSGSATIATFQGSDGLYRAFFGNTQHVINVTNGGILSIRPNEGTSNNPGFDFVTSTFGGTSYIEYAGTRYRIGHTGGNNANAGLLFQNRVALTSLNTPRFSFDVNSTSVTTTSGTSTGISYIDTFAAAAGSALYRPLSIAYTINNSGAQTGTTTGIFLNATETALNSMVHNLMDLQTGGVSRFRMTNTGIISTNTRLSGSFNTAASGSILTVIGSGSAQPIFTVQGSQGELFSVTDSLSGSLFSVNDISGLPIMEVFSDNTILMGDYQDPMLLTTRKITQTNSGSFVVYSIPTASYDGVFVEYTIKSGSNARAGTIMSTWAGSSIEFTEVDTMDIGSTTAVGLTMILSGSNAVMTGSSSTGTWTIRTIIRAI